MIGKMLFFFKIEYEEAEHRQEAVNIMAKSCNAIRDPEADHFGLVIMDLCMPVMDGYEAIKVLQKRGMGLPIIALTANALQEGQEKAIDDRAIEFATKPIIHKISETANNISP